MKCPTCGQIIRNDRDVCALCGTPLKRKRKGGASILALVLVGLLVAAASFFLLLRPSGYRSPADNGQEEPAGQQEEILQPDLPIETALPTPGGRPLFTDAVEIIVRDRYTLALCADGTVKLAGQSSSPEFGFDLFDWSHIVQLVAEDAWIAGLTETGRVRLTGEAEAYSAAAQWAEVEYLLFDAQTLFGLTIDGRVLAAGPDLSFDPAQLRDVMRLIPAGYDTLAVTGDNVAHVLPWLGMIWDADGLQGVVQAEINADFALFLMRDGSVRGSLNYTDLLAENDWDDPLAGWTDVKELILADRCVLGRTGDGRVLSASWIPESPTPDTSSWRGVVQLLYDRERNRALGLTEDGRVLQAVAVGEPNPAFSAWENVVLLRQNEYCTVGLTRDGRVLTAWEPGYAQIFEVGAWTGITDLQLSERHLAGLRDDGTVLVTGDNSFGQCG